MRTEHFQYAITVARVGSFSKAAEIHLVKQQSIRMAITNLEQELNVVLFERSPKGVTLTPEGKDVIQKMMSIMEIVDTMHIPSGTKAKEEWIVGVNSFGQTQLESIISFFSDSSPQIEVKLILEENTRQLMNGLLEGSLDIVITSIGANVLEQPFLAKQLDTNIYFEKIMSFTAGIYVEDGHPLAACDRIPVSLLKTYNLIAQNKMYVPQYLNQISDGLTLAEEIICDNPQIIVSYLHRGNYILLGAEGSLCAENVTFIPFEHQVPLLGGIFYVEKMKKKPAFQKFLQNLKKDNQP